MVARLPRRIFWSAGERRMLQIEAVHGKVSKGIVDSLGIGRKQRKRRMRFCLVPVRDRAQEISTLDESMLGLAFQPAKPLDGHPEILVKANGIHDVPPIH